MEALDALREKILTLETERSQLKDQIENLRRAAELRAASLERDIRQMREEMKILHEILAQETEVARPVTSVAPPPKPTLYMPQAPAISNTNDVSDDQNLLDDSTTETPANEDVPTSESSYDPILQTLAADERKVIELLMAHDGNYSQRNLRTDAGLSWLQTNRVISRLIERGIVTVDKTGNMDKVILKKQLK